MIAVRRLKTCVYQLLGVIVMTTVSAFATTLDFSNREDLPQYGTVNDTVMGGRSISRIQFANSNPRFTGNVSLENNGGFASVRYLIGPTLPESKQVSLTVKGDGQMYQLRFQMDGPYRGVSYAVRFQTIADEWQTFTFPVADFQPVWRGRAVRGAPALSMPSADRLSLYITDKQSGAFTLELGSVQFE